MKVLFALLLLLPLTLVACDDGAGVLGQADVKPGFMQASGMGRGCQLSIGEMPEKGLSPNVG